MSKISPKLFAKIVRIHARHASNSLYVSLSLVLIMGVSVSALVQPAHPKRVQVTTISAKKHAGPKVVPAKPKPVAVAPAPVSAPAPIVTVPAKPAPQPKITRTAPVVTPSPSSNVSGLTPSTPVSSPAPSSPPVTTGYNSLNWSGYLATGSVFTAASGSWIAPTATGNGTSTTADASWVGIGGVTSGDLIQVGTQNTISASGQVTTYAWYEMLPAFETPINTMAVHPGDSITASVTNTGGSQWTISIIDNSDSQSFSISVSYGSSFSSAEWIEEDPSFSSHQLVPFDNFGGVLFSGGSAVANGVSVSIAGSNALPVTMVTNSGQPIAIPTVLGGGGASFSVSP